MKFLFTNTTNKGPFLSYVPVDMCCIQVEFIQGWDYVALGEGWAIFNASNLWELRWVQTHGMQNIFEYLSIQFS